MASNRVPFLNAVVIADDPALDGRGWLRRAQELERAAERVREERWGPAHPGRRPRHVQLDGGREVTSNDEELTLPHPLAHQRAFVLVPWLAVDPAATLTVAGERRSVEKLLAELDPADRDGVRLTDAGAELMGPTRKRDLTAATVVAAVAATYSCWRCTGCFRRSPC